LCLLMGGPALLLPRRLLCLLMGLADCAFSEPVQHGPTLLSKHKAQNTKFTAQKANTSNNASLEIKAALQVTTS
jgi:hypothetical protein